MSFSPLRPAEHISLAPYTTIGLGGPARYFLSCRAVGDIQEGLAFARERSLPVLVLSGGSNLVIGDDGFNGVALHLALRGRRFEHEGASVRATFSAGEPWDECVLSAVEQGYAGIECLSGIPGSAGATPIQNVGAYGQEVGERIAEVSALDVLSGARLSFSADACSFGYRTSRFKGNDAGRFIIVEVAFRLTPNGASTIRYPELQRELAAADVGSLAEGREQLMSVRDAVLTLRKKKSMVVDPADPHSRSCGSFFTNPVLTDEEYGQLEQRAHAAGIGERIPHFPGIAGVKVSAAWLVEKAGYPKGFRRGKGGVSDHHSLALVNYGCTAGELLGLAADIEDGVFRKFSIRLRKEPVVI